MRALVAALGAEGGDWPWFELTWLEVGGGYAEFGGEEGAEWNPGTSLIRDDESIE